MNTVPQAAQVSPPARGSFPLDHGGACKKAADEYLQCIASHKATHYRCKDLSKAYLQCRMDRGLMAEEDLNTLGFSKDSVVVPAPRVKVEAEGEVIAGLASAKKVKGTIFGIPLPKSSHADK